MVCGECWVQQGRLMAGGVQEAGRRVETPYGRLTDTSGTSGSNCAAVISYCNRIQLMLLAPPSAVRGRAARLQGRVSRKPSSVFTDTRGCNPYRVLSTHPTPKKPAQGMPTATGQTADWAVGRAVRCSGPLINSQTAEEFNGAKRVVEIAAVTSKSQE